jgi:hypothetical protein
MRRFSSVRGKRRQIRDGLESSDAADVNCVDAVRDLGSFAEL